MIVVRDESFERIRAEVSRDLSSVTPLKPAWSRALLVIPIALITLAVVLTVYGLRGDADKLGFWSLWSPVLLMMGVAYFVVMMVLRNRTPGEEMSSAFWIVAPVLAVAMQIGTNFFTFTFSPIVPDGIGWQQEAVCFGRISLFGIPTLVVVFWLLSRGLPLRPRIVGFMSGLGAAILSESIYRLYCGVSHPGHTLPWHTGALLAMGLLGLGFGLWWERRRNRNLA